MSHEHFVSSGEKRRKQSLAVVEPCLAFEQNIHRWSARTTPPSAVFWQ
jgi:hypothetical protein